MDDAPTYEAETDGVVVRARPVFLAGQSDPAAGRWIWAYGIEIENRGSETVQLLTRHWTITDASGRVEQVDGPGVVGEHPTLRPGETYEYTSGCPLPTPSGSMVGRYRMAADDGRTFDVVIPAFSLDVPGERRTLN